MDPVLEHHFVVSHLKKDYSDPYGKNKIRGWEIFEKTLPRGHRESISSSMKFIIKKYFSYDDPITDIPISITGFPL